MRVEDPITKLTRIFTNEDGSQVKLICEAHYELDFQVSIDTYAFKRASELCEWSLCSDRPHPNWREMPLDDYLRYGRSELLRTVPPAQIFKLSCLLGTSLSAFEKAQREEQAECEQKAECAQPSQDPAAHGAPQSKPGRDG